MKLTRSEAAKLSGAIRRYNRIAGKEDLPGLNYSDIKGLIWTKREYKRQLKQIKGISEKNAKKYIEKVQKEDTKRALKRLNKMLEKAPRSEFLESDERAVIMGEIYNIKNMNKLTPYLRGKKLVRIKSLSSGDYERKQAENYREWYIKSIRQRYSHLPGYKDLMKKLESYGSGISFYTAIKGHVNESDIWDIRYSEASLERFNKILDAWGVDHDEYAEEEIYSGF